MRRSKIKLQSIFIVIEDAARSTMRYKLFGINRLDEESVRGV